MANVLAGSHGGQWYEKQVGPLPLGIWVGVVAVGVGASVLINRKTAGASSAAPSDSAGLTDATDGAFGTLPAGVNLGGVVALPGGIPSGQNANNPTGTTGIVITDNNQWLRTATDKLLALGYDPGLIDTSLRAYLAGNQLTATQQAILNEALRLLGSPPFPVVSLPPTSGGTTTPVSPTLASLGLSSTAVYLQAPSGTFLWDGPNGKLWRDRPITSNEKIFIAGLGSPPGTRIVTDAFIQQVIALEPSHSY